MRAISANSRIVRWAYWPGTEDIPPVIGACSLAGRLLLTIPVGLMIGMLFVLVSPALIAEWVTSKCAARSNPERHRRVAKTGARFCPWRFRVTDLPRLASKCGNRDCSCQNPPRHVAGLGWSEDFHCPVCGRVRTYHPTDGLQSSCLTCPDQRRPNTATVAPTAKAHSST